LDYYNIVTIYKYDLLKESIEQVNQMFQVIDFDMILLDYNLMVLGIGSNGYQAKCYQLNNMA
jgi:hypothetical protein